MTLEDQIYLKVNLYRRIFTWTSFITLQLSFGPSGFSLMGIPFLALYWH